METAKGYFGRTSSTEKTSSIVYTEWREKATIQSGVKYEVVEEKFYHGVEKVIKAYTNLPGGVFQDMLMHYYSI